MVIEHDERFGLAQLCGRVGRGAAESQCNLLFEEPLSDTTKRRLKVIYETHDGFEIAREDLAIRGPGEFLGARQSGVPMLRFANLERDAADGSRSIRRPRRRISRAGSAASRSSSARRGRWGRVNGVRPRV